MLRRLMRLPGPVRLCGGLAIALTLAGCGERDAGSDDPRAVVVGHGPVPVFGHGHRYHPPPSGRAASAGRPVGRLRCRRASPERYGSHLEIFANRHDLVIPAGIGVASPRVRSGAYVKGGRCSYPLRTLEPTGLIEIDEGVHPTVGELFDLWGQHLSRDRLLSFSAAPGQLVSAFVDGKRWRRSPRAIPLERHAAVVLEVGGYFPPTRRYFFPDGL
jgi:hypothetical protein